MAAIIKLNKEELKKIIQILDVWNVSSSRQHLGLAYDEEVDRLSKILQKQYYELFHEHALFDGHYINENEKKEIKYQWDDHNIKVYQNRDPNMLSQNTESPNAFLKRKLSDKYSKNKDILDLGCGTGFYFQFMRFAKSITGIDLVDNYLEIAKTMTNVPLKLINANIIDLPLENNSFDTVFAWAAVYHEDFNMVIKEVIRVLKPGGFFIFDMPNPNSFIIKGKEELNLFLYKIKEIRGKPEGLLVQSGLKLEKCYKYNLLPPYFKNKIFKIIFQGRFLSSLPLLRRYAGTYIFICKKADKL